ncbi:MAG: hypothetical protein QOF27_618, partial [Gaiellaceae bacterium]|nr:hypothetical protein [Gaiellaceae bacterium]
LALPDERGSLWLATCLLREVVS